jgi:dephospho-CoA kinase
MWYFYYLLIFSLSFRFIGFIFVSTITTTKNKYRMFTIGITGGIGSGKTHFCKLLESNHIPVYYADDKAKELYKTNSKLKDEVIKEFGEESYIGDEINRRYISSIIFTNKKKRRRLNTILKKYLKADFKKWVKEKKDNSKNFVVAMESAILIESGYYKNLSYNVNITADLDVRIKRVKSRDPERDEEEIKNIISSQISDEERMKCCNMLIDSTEANDELLTAYIDILKEKSYHNIKNIIRR